MKHIYKTVGWDGEKYTYICVCGHKVITTDGTLPVELIVEDEHKEVVNE